MGEGIKRKTPHGFIPKTEIEKATARRSLFRLGHRKRVESGLGEGVEGWREPVALDETRRGGSEFGIEPSVI